MNRQGKTKNRKAGLNAADSGPDCRRVDIEARSTYDINNVQDMDRGEWK